ncbi:MAG: nucleotidyltransferase family protein [Candidatus Marsarchaeota archaeon]|nr:nucleotidyltransferase family protein [Candidatus Marsarchaeota archaeon]
MERLIAGIVHYPSLKTVLAIEDVLRKANAPLSRNQILSRLPTPVMRSTLNLALSYLEKRGIVRNAGAGFTWSLDESRLDAIAGAIRTIREKAVPLLRQGNVKHAAVFGSVARNEATPRSDIDLLVEFRGKPTLLKIGALKSRLEEKLGKSVDLVMFNTIDRRLRKQIMREMVGIL